MTDIRSVSTEERIILYRKIKSIDKTSKSFAFPYN